MYWLILYTRAGDCYLTDFASVTLFLAIVLLNTDTCIYGWSYITEFRTLNCKNNKTFWTRMVQVPSLKHSPMSVKCIEVSITFYSYQLYMVDFKSCWL